MTSKPSSNSLFSGTLIMENLKRFWGISAVFFLFLFMSTTFTMLVDPGSSTVQLNTGTGSPMPFLITFCASIVAANAVFSYLYRMNSTAALHSMPFSRTKLFASNYISGFFISVIPAVLNTMIMLACRGIILNRMYGDVYDTYIDIDYSAGRLFYNLAFVVLTAFFVYSVSVLAAAVCGNSPVQILTSIGLNWVVPVIFTCGTYYASVYLRGWAEDDRIITETIFGMHPISDIFVNDNYASAGHVLKFIIIASAVTALAYFAYRQRKLERAGESYVYKWIGLIIGFLVTFAAATLTCALFDIIMLPVLIGGLLGFLFSRMIISRTFRVFNVKSLAVFAVYMAVIFAFILSFRFDLTGFEKKIPTVSETESVSISFGNYGNAADSFSEEANIVHIINLHKDITASLNEDQSYDNYQWIRIEYTLKNGSSFVRYYSGINGDILSGSEDLKAVYRSSEAASEYDRLLELDLNLCSFEINTYDGMYNEVVYDPYDRTVTSFKKDLVNAIYSDLKEDPLGMKLSEGTYCGSISLTYETSVKPGSVNPGELYREEGIFYLTPGEYNNDGQIISVCRRFDMDIRSSSKSLLKFCEEHNISVDTDLFY